MKIPLVTLVSVVLSLGCPDRPAPDGESAAMEAQLGDALNRFAFRVYRQIAAQDGNVTGSPLSLHLALLMAFEGAQENTAAELAKVLCLPKDTKGLKRAARTMIARMTGMKGDGFNLRIANGLWGQTGHPFDPGYVNTIANTYAAEIHHQDFVGASEASRLAINAAVAKVTNERIKDLIPKGLVDASTRLVLTNAIWFKAKWMAPFDKRWTKPAPFHLADGSTHDVSTMRDTGPRGYYEDDRVQVLELAYRGGEVAMDIVLPKAGQDLSTLERDLSPELWKQWTAGITSRTVGVHLPRFKTTYGGSMIKTLKAMGLSDALNAGRADFSGIDGGAGHLYISEVIHRTWVQVDEEGTEAAAATAVVLKLGAAMRKPVEFKADRPFLFAIRDTKSGALLFLGRVADPR